MEYDEQWVQKAWSFLQRMAEVNSERMVELIVLHPDGCPAKADALEHLSLIGSSPEELLKWWAER